MSTLDQDLSNEKKHALLKVEGPDVYGACMLDIVVKLFLRLQNSEEVAERMSMINQVYESI